MHSEPSQEPNKRRFRQENDLKKPFDAKFLKENGGGKQKKRYFCSEFTRKDK
jgi:hypothetical protein